MTTNRFASLAIAAALGLGACVPGAPSTAPQPQPDEISRVEVQQSGAATLHQLIQALRPEWLLIAADSTGAPAPEQVLVFVDGRFAGDARDLPGISATNLGRVQLVDAATARQRFARFPRQEFRVAIAASTFTTPAQAAGRMAVSAGVGLTQFGLTQGVENGAEEAGMRAGTADPRVGWPDQGTRTPLSAHLTARYDVRPALAVSADVQHTLESWYGGYLRPEDDGSGLLSTRFTSTELALLVSTGRLLRVGVGPAVRHVRWEWASTLCACEQEESQGSTALGGAAVVGVSLPQGGRWFADFSVRARYYPSQEAGPYRHLQSLDAGGLAVTPSVGFGVRF